MLSDWWKFNECMMSGTRPPVRCIRQGEEGVRASHLGPSQNQASADSEYTVSVSSNFKYSRHRT